MNSRRMGGIVLTALTLAASLASAQETRGRIQGIVLDPSKAAIADAKVTLRNDGTGVAISRQTSRGGRYIFDYVDPGQYTLVFEMAGFKRLEQKNVLVQQRGDVTVDATLQMGEITEVVTVAESPVAVQFNTASRDLTIDQQMLRDLPSITGNPFQMALLDPSVVNRGSGETQPYFHRAANELDYGGGTKYRNDMLLDGTPLVAGNKLGYTPPSDAVTEYTVAQNAVDAEFGHSGGGIVLVTMKSGSNDLHGSAYYFGRNPDWNAMTNRASTPRAHSQNPHHRAGGTVGFPLRKNRLFMFAVLETMVNTNAVDRYYTLPTALERQGDFSQSKTATGALRVIYNPFTTVRVGNNYTRQAFAGNKIPSDLWDPVAKRIMDSLWNAKNAGQDPSGTRNFTYLEEDKFHYYNFSTRLDWQINDEWKAWARLSRLKTDQNMPDFTEDWGGDPLKARSNTGSKRNGWNVAADTVYLLSPTTAVNLRGAYFQVVDKRDYPELAIGPEGYQDLWTYRNKLGQTVTNSWWAGQGFDYMAGRPLVYFPSIAVENSTVGQLGVPNFWFQEPSGASVHARLSKYLTKHSLKVGTEMRLKRGQAARFYFSNFSFTAQETGSRATSADSLTGSPWASFLLGALNGNSNAQYRVMEKANTEMYAVYVQDDFKVHRNLTLNLGLRWEYEGGLWDPLYRLPQQLDLTDPIPGMEGAIAPKLAVTNPLLPATDPANPPPTTITALMAQSTGQRSFIFNGAYRFTEEGDKRKNHVDRNGFMPRIGVAWRLGERTALRAGYGRFIVPASLSNSERDTLGEIDLGGFTPTTNIVAPSANNYVPVATLSNPFPNGLNPATGKALGRYTNLGNAVTFDKYELTPPISDRFNISIQRELPGRIILDAGFLVNLVSRDYYNKNLNQMDPRLSYTYKAALNTQVANPFYNYGDPKTNFPGTMRTLSKVPVSSLLVPYPQYGAITQTSTNLRKARYQVMLIRLQRTFSKGLSFLASYAYVKTRSQWFYDTQDEYDGNLSWFDFAVSQSGGGGNPQIQMDPRHRLTLSGTADFPVGRRRALGRGMPSALDAIIGGWQIAGIFTYNAGAPLVFTGAMSAPESVTRLGQAGGPDKYWFQTKDEKGANLFGPAVSYTRRSNPWTFDGLTGPSFRNLDLSLIKRVKLSERVKVRLRLDAFNALNGMNWAAPNLSVSATDFGRTNTQSSGYVGRQIQYSARIEF